MTNWYDDIVSAIVGAINAIFLKKSDIADNLTTNDATKVLSAKQGKLLNDNKANVSAFSTVEVLVTYTDDTTETLTLYTQGS